MSRIRKPEQQLLGIGRPAEKVSNWHGPRETKYMRWRRLRREELQHEDRKDAEVADILRGIRLGRIP
jgi:hypothetical protein